MKTVLLSISACLLLAFSIASSETGVEVISASEDLLESRPRTVVTSVFFVTNWADREIELAPGVTLPQGWPLVASDRSLRLGPGQRQMSLVSFLIPRTARAGSYTVGYSVRSKGEAARRDSSSITVDVLPVTRLRLEVLDCPEFVVAGETYEVSVALMNQGNTTTEVEVSSTSHTGFVLEGSMESLSLSPGRSAGLRISVKTDPGIRRVTQERLSIVANALSEAGTRERAWCYLEILPRTTEIGSRFNRVPVRAAIRYVREANGWNRSGAQGLFQGSGNLGQSGHQHVDFAFRGPDMGQNRLLGDRDEYYLKYRYGSQTFILGDYSYSVSPLTENHRYGRGGKVSAVFNRLRLSGYHMKARWAEPDMDQTAGHVDCYLGDDSMVGLRYLKKAEGQSAEIVSLESRLHPATDTDLEMEYARRLTSQGDNEAYRLKFLALAGWGSYLLRFIHADPEYPGFFQNMDFMSTALGLNLSRDFRFDASVRQERHNLNLAPSGYSAPLERDYRLRLLFRSGAATDYSLAYRFRESKDRFAEPIFNFRERSVRAALNQRYGRWDCHGAVELGRTLDRLSNRTKQLERYTASLRIRPTKNQSYHGYLYFDRNGGSAQHAMRHISAGVTASVWLSSSTMLNAGYRSNLLENSEDQARDVLELSVRQRLFGETELVLRGHYTDYRDSEESRHMAFMVEYNIPFGMPVSRREEVGTLKGKVYDQETGRPLGDVIFKLDGATAISDRAGGFGFPTVTAGTHHLKVDRSTIRLDRITRQRFPAAVTIQGGKTQSIEVAVVRGASISGRIDLYAYEDSTSGVLTPDSRRHLVKTAGLANAMIELTDGDETKRSFTTGDGSFSVKELRPGRWVLSIPPEILPEHHRVENGELGFDLRPGAEETVEIRIVPTDRRVRIIEEGGTLTEHPTK